MASLTAQRAALRTQIAAKIAEYQHNDVKPPFSFGELVVMAILSKDEELVAKQDIYLWMMTTFQYYHDRMLIECAAKAGYPEEISVEDAMEQDDVEAVWNDYNVPLSRDIGHDETASNEADKFTVHVPGARLFLRNIFEAPPKGQFPIFELPAELRVRIYEMVFSFPDIHFGYNSIGAKMSFCRREHNKEHKYPTNEAETCVVGPRLGTVLALLTANKQLFNEALPFFYRLNRFHFYKPPYLAAFVDNIGLNRLQHVRHISIWYQRIWPDNRKQFETSLGQLVSVGRLRTLEIVVTDKYWFSDLPYLGPADMPCMSKLTKLVEALDELTFCGDCRRIEAYLRAHMKVKAAE